MRDGMRRQLTAALVRNVAAVWEDENLKRLELRPSPGYETVQPPDEETEDAAGDSPEA